ncbi:MAG: recombinase family protein [Clostridia bacterium]|nr:recombinase family protein [Clostridia bacterium]
MNDVRHAAEQRAAQPKGSPVGASFESERQREKNAFIKQLDALDGRNVRKIAAAAETPEEDRVLRVAAYCRVSTDDIDQKLSIHLQIQQYMKKIKENPNWKYAGCYVDDGFSGTNTDHRQGFQQLMKDAMDGKIDMIITKAVSRFARNLMDCIGWVEALQNHDPPVRVFFEQENLDTTSQTSGIILFVLAMVAQEESHMKSEAILLSLEWRFSRGRFLTPRLFGYDKIEVPDGFGGRKKILSVNESEARVVRWMYSTLLNGGTPEEIASVLTEMAIPTGGRRRDGTLNTHWKAHGVVATMRNEKHCGDVLARNTYTPNYKDHKSRKNNGKKNKYFQPDHHEAIVPRSMWNAAQRILNSRRFGHEGTYLPMRIIDRGTLAGYISMNRTWAGFDYEDYYCASQIAMGLLDEELTHDLGSEYLPEGGHRIGGLVDDHGIAQIARDLTAAEQEIKDELEGRTSEASESVSREEAARSFQVVSGDMFSRVHDPVIRITPNSISFNKSCVSKLLGTEYAEILFNPVERMLVVRPCAVSNPNFILWKEGYRGASPLSKVLYDSMGWETDYSFRVPCQAVKGSGPAERNTVLVFDLDNYIGRASDKTDEVIIAKKTAETVPEEREDAKSFYYPPDEDEPKEIRDVEDKFERAVEANRRYFGTPVFMHESGVRGVSGECTDGEWDMMIEAKPLDITHTVDESTVDDLLSGIMDDPPQMPAPKRGIPRRADNRRRRGGIAYADIKRPGKEPSAFR